MTRVRSVTFVVEAAVNRLAPPPSAYYRAHLPAVGLRKLGVTVNVCPMFVTDPRTGKLRGVDHWGVAIEQRQTAGKAPSLRITGIRDRRAILPPSDVVVVRTPVGPDQQLIDSTAEILAARHAGQKVFLDWDDDVWNLPPDNPAFATWQKPVNRRIQEANMDSCDGVLTSTWTLAEVMEDKTVAPIYVCPNGVEPGAYPRKDFEHEPLRVGWQGFTKWRGEDFRQEALIPVGRELHKRKMSLWHLGDDPANPTFAEMFPSFVPPVHEIASVATPDLPRLIQTVDVMIIPMRDLPINRSRSATAALACCAAGVPFAATETRGYTEALGQYPRLPDDLPVLLDDPKARSDWREYGHLVALAHRPSKVAQFWLDAFRTCDGWHERKEGAPAATDPVSDVPSDNGTAAQVR